MSRAWIWLASRTAAGMWSCDWLAPRHQRHQHNHQPERRANREGVGRSTRREPALFEHPDPGRIRQRHPQRTGQPSEPAALHRGTGSTCRPVLWSHPIGRRCDRSPVGRDLRDGETPQRARAARYRYAIRCDGARKRPLPRHTRRARRAGQRDTDIRPMARRPGELPAQPDSAAPAITTWPLGSSR